MELPAGAYPGPRRLLVPRDLYFLAIVILVRLTCRGGLSFLRRAAIAALSSAAYLLSRHKRRIVEGNVARALGELGPALRRRIVRGSFRGFWEEIFFDATEGAVFLKQGRIEVHGIEEVQAALRRGQGAILWESKGFGPRLLAKQALRWNGVAVAQVHGANEMGAFVTEDSRGTRLREAWVLGFFVRRELRVVSEIIRLPSSSSLAFTRLLHDRLRRNGVVCVPADGRAGLRHLDLPFLGGTAPFATGMVTLSRITGAPLFPMFCVKAPGGRVRLVIERPIVIEREADRHEGVRKALATYLALLETHIRRRPELYRNWHRLGEARPPGDRPTGKPELPAGRM